MTMADPVRVRYEIIAEGVAKVTLARPELANAQDMHMLYQLDQALVDAAEDAAVRVVILAADGPIFSLGHDIDACFSAEGVTARGFTSGLGAEAVEGSMAWEEEVFFGLSWRWRNFPKPLLAQVQGAVSAGGLMLVWPCDIIMASETALFSDPVVALGCNGVELFLHPWEFGPRKAMELLFTGDSITATEAHSLGMVNHVVAAEELEAATLEMARKIALRPSFALKLAKQSVHAALDAQGQQTALKSAFALHQVAHSHNRLKTGRYIDPNGLSIIGAPEDLPIPQ
jgi:enoyl-CoA hydratase/carnithine racemase